MMLRARLLKQSLIMIAIVDITRSGPRLGESFWLVVAVEFR
jgi:hypothetical protein